MSRSFTPGPWMQNPAEPEQIIADGDVLVICRVPSARMGLYNSRAPANARLISAAPDLLQALEWIASNYENGDLNHVDFRVEAKHRADAAIAKATGAA